jgi:hypothetical protein
MNGTYPNSTTDVEKYEKPIKHDCLRSSTVNFHPNSHLIHEAMSRARMPKPQDNNSEASRSARWIAMRSRDEQNRILGNQ